ncbi:MAG: hypothetical protein U1A78_39135 [Polyangia bacterium]
MKLHHLLPHHAVDQEGFSYLSLVLCVLCKFLLLVIILQCHLVPSLFDRQIGLLRPGTTHRTA